MPTEGDDDGLVLNGQHGRLRLFRPGRLAVNGAALPPLGDGLLVDAVTGGQGSQAFLTTLYRSTDCRCRCGAAVENLAHSASFHPRENTAPSNPGIKQLASLRAITGLVGLTAAQTFEATGLYAASGGIGPRLYDALIGRAAVVHGIPGIVTWNVGHMRGLFPNLDVLTPEAFAAGQATQG